MKQSLLLVTFIVLSAPLFAQSAKEKQAYADEAAVLQKQIWDNQTPEFKSATIPANLNKESAVILARSFSLSRSSTGKFKFGHAISFTTRTKKFSIYHERVKINDKTALAINSGVRTKSASVIGCRFTSTALISALAEANFSISPVACVTCATDFFTGKSLCCSCVKPAGAF